MAGSPASSASASLPPDLNDSTPGLSSLPSVTARVVAFAAILLAGLCGAVIGWAVVGFECAGTCTTPKSIGAITSTLLFAGGAAIVSVLSLRALAEWNANK
jgi:hypothetical protein